MRDNQKNNLLHAEQELPQERDTCRHISALGRIKADAVQDCSRL